jgi:predicted metal-dependent hydrolase
MLDTGISVTMKRMNPKLCSVQLEDRTIVYEVRRSPRRRKTLSILIRPHENIVVRAPVAAREAEIDRFVAKKGAWVLRKLRAIEAAGAGRREYRSGEMFKFLGRDYPLAVKDVPGKRSTVVFEGGCLTVRTPLLPEPQRNERIKRALQAWYVPRAESCLTKLAADWSDRIGLKPEGLKVKNLKSSWGICNRRRLSLNWRLVMAPPHLAEYVVVHELCHLRHHNHSPAFHRLVASYVPDYQQRRKELKQLGPHLDI